MILKKVEYHENCLFFQNSKFFEHGKKSNWEKLGNLTSKTINDIT